MLVQQLVFSTVVIFKKSKLTYNSKNIYKEAIISRNERLLRLMHTQNIFKYKGYEFTLYQCAHFPTDFTQSFNFQSLASLLLL